MTISQILVTTWLVFSVGQAVHDDFAQRRSEASAQFFLGDDVPCTGSDCGQDCWRPVLCKRDTKFCPGNRLPFKRCGWQCRFPECPAPVCPTDVRECDDGTILNRDPLTCEFPQCPEPRPCSPSLGFHTCEDGTRVGRDPNNLCITWLPCPAMWTCANGQRIRLDRVCNGRRNCRDGSDESPNYGCQQFTIGRRIEGEIDEAIEESEPALEQESDDSERRRQGWFNCWSNDSRRRWTSAKKRYCCNNFGVAEQIAMPQAKYNCRRSANSPKNEFTRGGEYNCNYGQRSSWTSAKARFCCRTQGKGCRRNNSGGPSIGRRLDGDIDETAPYTEIHLPAIEEAEPALEQESDGLERRRQGWYNCWTYDLQRNWSSAKKRFCCNNYSIACRRSSQNEYNCNSGKRSNWTSGKARFCCRTQGKGCRRTNSGRRLEESDSSENADYYDDESSESADYYDNEFDLESEPDQASPDYFDDELDLESEPDQESPDYYDDELDLESEPDQASML